MITVTPSCDTYNLEVKKIANLLFFKKLILILPIILIIALSITLATILHKPILLVILLVAVFYFVIIKCLLSLILKTTSKKMVDKYCDYYGVDDNNKKVLSNIWAHTNSLPLPITFYLNCTENPASPECPYLCHITNDNQGWLKVVHSSNLLYARIINETLCFISAKPISISKVKLTKLSKEEFLDIINSDFGCMKIPLNEIDHYRECVMVCSLRTNSLCKITFSDSIMLDNLIPTKDFYYQSKKRDNLS